MSANQASSRKFSLLFPSTRMAPNSISIHAALKALSGIGTWASPSFLSASCIHLLKSLLARLIFRHGDISPWCPPLAHGQGVRTDYPDVDLPPMALGLSRPSRKLVNRARLT